jgi:hypothetical protein
MMREAAAAKNASGGIGFNVIALSYPSFYGDFMAEPVNPEPYSAG